jgi:hypothetical protein
MPGQAAPYGTEALGAMRAVDAKHSTLVSLATKYNLATVTIRMPRASMRWTVLILEWDMRARYLP